MRTTTDRFAVVLCLPLPRGTGLPGVTGDLLERAARFERKCSRPKCGGDMRLSQALAQTYSGVPDFPGREVVTMSPGGPGKLVPCWKCMKCGHSVTA